MDRKLVVSSAPFLVVLFAVLLLYWFSVGLPHPPRQRDSFVAERHCDVPFVVRELGRVGVRHSAVVGALHLGATLFGAVAVLILALEAHLLAIVLIAMPDLEDKRVVLSVVRHLQDVLVALFAVVRIVEVVVEAVGQEVGLSYGVVWRRIVRSVVLLAAGHHSRHRKGDQQD